MVHQLAARLTERTTNRPYGHASPEDIIRAKPHRPDRYVFVPDMLIGAFAHDPLAVGVYIAIARFSIAAKDAVPLAARDLAAWMGNDCDAARAALMRRIVKLEARGWVLVTRTPATKHTLLPTWGRDHTGLVRPWRTDQSDSGRPSHVRGRRVPLGLLDDYVGRLDPQSGPGHALISRYFTQPLLDLADIGVYAIGLRAEIVPTPRLHHLGLHTIAGMVMPSTVEVLLERAAAGQLTTIRDDSNIQVWPSIQGHTRLDIASPIVGVTRVMDGTHLCGSMHGSHGGSLCRSHDPSDGAAAIPQQNDLHKPGTMPTPQITWDVGINHELTNHESAPDRWLAQGGGSAANHDRSVAEQLPSHQETTCPWQPLDKDRAEPAISSLFPGVIAGHRALNPNRHIFTGEWYEMLILQEAHGAEQLLIWQARAERAVTDRPYGITPAYYRACVVRAECAAYRPQSQRQELIPITHDLPCATVSIPVVLDPACDTLLQAIGVRERQKLAAVSYDLIVAWQTALAHPGMSAHFAAPVGFAVKQMQHGNPPPAIAELDRWANHARRKDDRYETWRHMDSSPRATNTTSYENALEERVRAIAPPNADVSDLCLLAYAIEAGATDMEALACLTAQHWGGGR